MIVLSHKLTTGEITVILRIVIQILSYGGIFLIGLLVLGNTPRIAPFETHDILNRFVGQNTFPLASFKWIFRRIFQKHKDPVPSSPLIIALVLSLSYGVFVSVTDLALLGVRSCTVSTTVQEFPASVKSDSDAMAITSANMMNGTDPNLVKYHRCDVAKDVNFQTFNLTICTEWYNSTYGDSSAFNILNTTDSDVLMPGMFGRDTVTDNGTSNLNIYLLGASDAQTVMEPTIRDGIAVLPDETGVKMIVGVPQLARNQTANVPKTLALEVDIGCMPVGVVGAQTSIGLDSLEFFIPDAMYLPKRMNEYSGPDYLQVPLANSADKVRAWMLHYFNSSASYPGKGYYPTSNNESFGEFSPLTVVSNWLPIVFSSNETETNMGENTTQSILDDCFSQINKVLNVTDLAVSTADFLPAQCGLYEIRGSYIQDFLPSQGHAKMICATTTQVNMVSAIFEMDANGTLAYNLTHIASDLNIGRASYLELGHNSSNTEDRGYLTTYDPMIRYTLSDNPSAPFRHYIYQERAIVGAAPKLYFSRGGGNIGVVFSQVGSAMVSYSSLDIESTGIVNPNFFTTNFSAREVTRWAGGLGASYLLSSVGYNGWAARGSPALTVITGGQEATCYTLRYATAFLPLFLAAAIILIWIIVMMFTSKIRRANTLQELYGGLSTTISYSFPWKPPSNTNLEWQNYPEPHLRQALVGQTDTQYSEPGILLPNKEDGGSEAVESHIPLTRQEGNEQDDSSLHVGE